MSGSVFIGLVTHRRSQYRESSGETGLAETLATELRARALQVTVSIHDEDRFEDSGLTIDADVVRASINEEMRVEGLWRQRLSPGTPSVAIDAFMALRGTYRRLRYAPPWSPTLAADDAGPRMVRRLANIELAHLSLIQQARDSGAAWALILEDDAWCPEVSQLADDLHAFVLERDPQRQPRYLNVSRSFSDTRLGSSAHGRPCGTWGGRGDAQLISYERAITNTVCAVLYRGEFLDALVPVMQAIPLTPVIPIDWKLNLALMTLEESGDLRPDDCWSVDPAPIVQRSMHSNGS